MPAASASGGSTLAAALACIVPQPFNVADELGKTGLDILYGAVGGPRCYTVAVCDLAEAVMRLDALVG